jgi:hypothetical protein
LTRGKGNATEGDNGELTDEDLHDNEDGLASKYFRNYHSPAILSKPGKLLVLIVFAGLFAFGSTELLTSVSKTPNETLFHPTVTSKTTR